MGGVANATLRPLYPRKQNWYPLYGKLVEHQGSSGRVRKNSLQPGFDLQTVQSVSSHEGEENRIISKYSADK
jgi:hypothetical protein